MQSEQNNKTNNNNDDGDNRHVRAATGVPGTVLSLSVTSLPPVISVVL